MRQAGKLNVTVTATDIAGNVAVMTASIVIDTGSPTVTVSAETGKGWNSADEKETDAADGVKVVMERDHRPGLPARRRL